MKQLLSYLSRLTKEDAKELEKESLNSTDDRVGLSSTELWELEKLKNKKADWNTFHDNMTYGRTYSADELSS